MSLPQEHLGRVQRLYATFAKREIFAILELLADDVEWGEPGNNPHVRRYPAGTPGLSRTDPYRPRARGHLGPRHSQDAP
jgi:ketosteroid isomerase-like protein